MSFSGFGQNNQQQSSGFGGFGSTNNTTGTGKSYLNFPFTALKLVRGHSSRPLVPSKRSGMSPSDFPISWNLGFGQPQNSGFGTGSGSTLFGSNNTTPSGGFGSGAFMAQAVLHRLSSTIISMTMLQSQDGRVRHLFWSSLPSL